MIERLIDDAARELGMDRVELRRKNLIPASAMPYKNALGVTYDCGDFEQSMDEALSSPTSPASRRGARPRATRGKLRGLGLANAIERRRGPQPEFAEIRFAPSGSATVLMGSKNQGQGHETTFKQILHERLGLDPAEVRYIDGDTDRVALGMGTHGLALDGDRRHRAVDGRRQGHRQGQEDRGAAARGGRGRHRVRRRPLRRGRHRPRRRAEGGRARRVPAARSCRPASSRASTRRARSCRSSDTWPNGCHVCEVEIDPDTGEVALVALRVVDDVGTVINPITLKGQIHGGVAQGVGQALMEQVVYDPESGQLLTASFMDYAMPRADDLLRHAHREPTRCRPS